MLLKRKQFMITSNKMRRKRIIIDKERSGRKFNFTKDVQQNI